MSQELYQNATATTLASGITSGNTTLTVKAGTGANFPQAATGTSQFAAVLIAPNGNPVTGPLEFIEVTNVSTDTFTVIRASENATANPAQAWPAGTVLMLAPTAAAMLNVILQAVPYTQYAHAQTGVTGAGTEASPWVHSDTTGGIQTAVNTLAAGRGGECILAPGRFNVTDASGISITTPAIRVSGLAGAEDVGFNPATAGISGTKLQCSGIGFTVGATSKPGIIRIENAFLNGNGTLATTGVNAAVYVSEPCDQLRLLGLHACNFSAFVYIASGINADSLLIDQCSAQNSNGYGIYFVGGADYFRIHNSQFFDNNYQALYLTGSNGTSGQLSCCMIGRNNYSSGLTNPSNVFWGVNNGEIVGNTFYGAGMTASGSNTTADELVLAGNNNAVTGNTFQNTNGYAVRISGSNNYIGANCFISGGIIINSGATGNIINAPGVTVTDNSGGTTNLIGDAGRTFKGAIWQSNATGALTGFGGGDTGFYVVSPGGLQLVAKGANAALLDGNGNFNVNGTGGNLTTTATGNMSGVPVCGGQPTGTPTVAAGNAAHFLDPVNGKAWYYYNGGWHYVLLV